MKREYDGAGKGIKPTAYRASHRPGQQSVSAQAWMQEVSAKQRHVEIWCSMVFDGTGELSPLERVLKKVDSVF